MLIKATSLCMYTQIHTYKIHPAIVAAILKEFCTMLERVCGQTKLCQLRCFNDYTRQHVSAPYWPSSGCLQERTKKLQNSILATRPYRASSHSIPPHATYKLIITQQSPDVAISPSRARTLYIVPVVYQGGVWVFNPPPKFRRPSKIVPNYMK